ncbi:unnamed protein product [Lactuca saligna]|uniref:Uncharacterized protein n=1 Tax=Lactuca saligna TaxID=75948 RepID=A0AA36EJU5_LACSI|nr:unnamed protein product [Lactuca saligna]
MQWLWVNWNLMGRGFHKTRHFPDCLPKLFRSNLTLDKRLGNITVVWGEIGRFHSCCGWYECLLASSWEDVTIEKGDRSRVPYESLYSTFICTVAEAEIYLEMALRGHYPGRLYHREINLVEALPPHVSERRMREFAGLILVERGNVGSSGPATPSQPTVGVVSLVRSSVPAPFAFPVGVQAGKCSAPIQKRRSLRMVPSSDEETESDDAGLRPRKSHRTVSVASLLGGIEGILGDRFFVPKKK